MHGIDMQQLTATNAVPCGGSLRRCATVLNCWFNAADETKPWPRARWTATSNRWAPSCGRRASPRSLRLSGFRTPGAAACVAYLCWSWARAQGSRPSPRRSSARASLPRTPRSCASGCCGRRATRIRILAWRSKSWISVTWLLSKRSSRARSLRPRRRARPFDRAGRGDRCAAASRQQRGSCSTCAARRGQFVGTQAPGGGELGGGADAAFRPLPVDAGAVRFDGGASDELPVRRRLRSGFGQLLAGFGVATVPCSRDPLRHGYRRVHRHGDGVGRLHVRGRLAHRAAKLAR